ncbi:MAG TPA: SIMPL domain-containing protein [Candidatus Binataceae bacterium]|nr:SIMPL domain-containing protein [Candidatus Binataceae bacterium]
MRTTLLPFLILLASFVAGAIGLPATAQADQPRTIVVSGNGDASARPDLANLSFAIEVHAKTATEAASRNAAAAQKVTDALKARLGDKGKVSTGGYSLTPDYQQHQNGGMNMAVIVGYNAQNTISVETSAMDLLGELIDAGIAAGANRVNALDFTLKNDTRARAEALANASRDAQQQAQALAASLNVRLGRIMTASTEGQPRPIPVERGVYAQAAVQSFKTPVEAGDITVSATVYLTYEIE